MNYVAVSAAQRMGFLDLRRYLQAFVDNEDKVNSASIPRVFARESVALQLRSDPMSLQLWTLCVRTKRGLVDTSRAGGYCKDQVSFAGLMQLLQNRKSISFELLHSCKLPWQCIASNQGLQRACDRADCMLLPEFIREGEAEYQRKLDHLVQVHSTAAHACHRHYYNLF